MTTNYPNPMTPTPLSLKEKMNVMLWRNLMSPLFTAIGGGSYPAGRRTEQKYGRLPGETVDCLKAATHANGPQKTAIVHIHGGGWVSGSKGRFYAKPLLHLANAGYPVFSLNYPLAPEHPHPFLLRSLLQGLAWIKQNYPTYGSIHLLGDSAGGNLAMMLGIMLANPPLLKLVDAIDPALLPTVKSIVPIYAPLERITWVEDGFPSASLFLKAYTGENGLAKTPRSPIPVMPMDFPTVEMLPPIFIAAGSKDKLLRSSTLYAEHLRKSFQQVDFKVYEGADHGFFNFGTKSDELRNDILNFLARHE